MKILRTVSRTFLLIGLFMLGGGGYLAYSQQRFIASADTAQGYVEDLLAQRSRDSDGRVSITYRPVVVFETPRGMIRHESNTGSNPAAYAIGERVEVYYDPANPSDAVLSGFFSLWGGALIVGAIGFVFSLIGGGIVFAARRRAALIERLKRSGERLRARLASVEQNASVEVNGRSPWRLSCRWQDPSTQEMHVFLSDNLWYDPSEHLSPGQEIDVLVDRQNRKRYFVDTSFLPALAG